MQAATYINYLTFSPTYKLILSASTSSTYTFDKINKITCQPNWANYYCADAEEYNYSTCNSNNNCYYFSVICNAANLPSFSKRLGNLCKNSEIIFSFKSKFPLWPRYGVAFRQPVSRKSHEIFVWSGWGTMHSVQVWLPVFEAQRVPLSQITTPHVLCSVYKYN